MRDKLPKKIGKIVRNYGMLQEQVKALEAAVMKVQKMNSFLSKENECQGRILKQLSSFLKSPNSRSTAVELCDQSHAFCRINHLRFNYVKPVENASKVNATGSASNHLDVENAPEVNVTDDSNKLDVKTVEIPSVHAEKPMVNAANTEDPSIYAEKPMMNAAATGLSPYTANFFCSKSKPTNSSQIGPNNKTNPNNEEKNEIDDMEFERLFREGIRSGKINLEEFKAISGYGKNGPTKRLDCAGVKPDILYEDGLRWQRGDDGRYRIIEDDDYSTDSGDDDIPAMANQSTGLVGRVDNDTTDDDTTYDDSGAYDWNYFVDNGLINPDDLSLVYGYNPC